MIRRRLLLLLGALLLFSMPLAALAASDCMLEIETAPGQANTVIVNINISENSDIAMMQFCIGYDSEHLSLISSSAGGALAGNTPPTLNTSEEGKVYFAWDSLNALTQAGSILQLELRVLPGSDEGGSLWFDFDEERVFADDSFSELDVAFKKDAIHIDPPEKGNDPVPASPSQVPAITPKQAQGYNNGLTLSDNTLWLPPGQSGTLQVNEKDNALVWSSSNESVAVVENGAIRAVGNGSVLITATTVDGQKEAVCAVTVSDTEPVSAENAPVKDNTAIPTWVWIVMGIAAATLGTLLFLNSRKAKAPQGME